MDEVQMNNLETDNSAASAHTESLQKIYRKGDKIYHVDDENVTMIQEAYDQAKVPSDLSHEQVDQVSSGESLYKTFSFDNAISKEETEKCISFWRSVVEKNLEPIKCTIIEKLNNSEHPINKLEKRSNEKAKKQKKMPGMPSLKESPYRNSSWFHILEELQKRRLDKTKLLLEKRCRICEYTTAAPYETDDFKKGIKSDLRELDDWQPKSSKHTRFSGSKSSKKPSDLSVGSPKRQSILSSENKSSITRQNISSADQIIVEVPPDVATEVLDDPFLIQVKEEADKIEYIDAIEMKKREQIYSKWRHNKVETACKCLRMECDCNTNPAVVDITNKTDSHHDGEITEESLEGDVVVDTLSDHPNEHLTTSQQGENSKQINEVTVLKVQQGSVQSAESVEIIELDANPTETRSTEKASHSLNPEGSQTSDDSYQIDVTPNQNNNSIEKDESDISNKDSTSEKLDSLSDRPRRSILKIKSERKSYNQYNKASSKKSLSVMLQCICSNEECDCKHVVKVVQKEKLPVQDLKIPEPPRIRTPSIRRVNSMEIIKRQLSVARTSRISQMGILAVRTKSTESL